MLLIVDIGNTQTSFGVYQEGTLLHHWRAGTKASRTPDEYAALLFPLLDHHQLKGVHWDSVAICSVVPSADHSIESFCRTYLKVPFLKIDTALDLGFHLNVDTPSEVGADRLANAAYAVRWMKLPALVVDFGTATTFDVVTAGNVYEGGVILPGVKICLEGLGVRTAKLPIVGIGFPESVIGKNTVDCIRGGVLYGYCDMIDGLLERTKKECVGLSDIVLTGGLASLFQNRLRTPTRLLPNLTLDGIELLFQRARLKEVNTPSQRNH